MPLFVWWETLHEKNWIIWILLAKGIFNSYSFIFPSKSIQILVKSLFWYDDAFQGSPPLHQIFSHNSRPLLLPLFDRKTHSIPIHPPFWSSSKFEWKLNLMKDFIRTSFDEDLVLSWFHTSLIKGLTFPFLPFLSSILNLMKDWRCAQRSYTGNS